MRSGVRPVRQAWIRQRAPQIDVLFVNPKLVETGLDLVMFSDLVFFETSVSLYTLWQAMRRVWRLGQEKDVHVTFLAYAGTMEETILARMGQKMKYAQLLYGKDAGGCLVETDDADLQREIIQAALEGKAYKSLGQAVRGVFTTGSEQTHRQSESPAGSPLASSPAVVKPPRKQETIQLNFFDESSAVQMAFFGVAASASPAVRKRRR